METGYIRDVKVLLAVSRVLSEAQAGESMLKSEVVMPTDTHPQIEAYQLQLIRQAPAWHKAHMLGQMHQTVKQLAYLGLRHRHPGAGEAELRRRLAGLLLGEELALQVYGPLVPEEPSHAD